MRAIPPAQSVTEALAKTGFLLEHDVARQFKAAGWSTINGRYYLDDVEETVRELDMVAYRVTKAGEIDVVTAVLLSCKKDSANSWAFMSREKPAKDPNFDWNPVSHWTDVQPLRTYLAHHEWRQGYLGQLSPVARGLFHPTRDVFAYQLISNDGRPQNDKPIFSSVSGLMKALDHEINVLPARAKGHSRVYQLNLATVVDAPMVEVAYDTEEALVSERESLVYFARYMVRKREVSGIVHFIRHDKLRDFIGRLDTLASENVAVFPKLCEAAYDSVLTVPQVCEYFSEEVAHVLRRRLSGRAEKLGHGHGQVEGARLGSSPDHSSLVVYLDTTDEVVEALMADGDAMAMVRDVLVQRVRYKGSFSLDWDVPF